MEVTSSVWSTVDCSLYGVLMTVGESVITRCDNVSVTIPLLRRQAVGTLVLTNKRFVFLLPGPFQAYTCNISAFVENRMLEIPGFPDFLCLFLSTGKEHFTFQGKRESIVAIQTGLYEGTLVCPDVQKTIRMVKPVKRIGGGEPKHAGLDRAVKLANARMQADKETVAAIKSLNDIKERAEILLKFAKDLEASAHRGKAQDAQLQRVCLAVGIESPVQSPQGDAGLRQIAKEFADVVAAVFRSGVAGTVLTKAEAYACYMRARKSNLLSPRDVEKAIELIAKSKVYAINVERIGTLDLIMPERVTFVRHMLHRFKRMRRHQFYTAMSLAKEFNIPLKIAEHFLRSGVECEALAIDESMAGVRYYRNRFHKFHFLKIKCDI